MRRGASTRVLLPPTTPLPEPGATPTDPYPRECQSHPYQRTLGQRSARVTARSSPQPAPDTGLGTGGHGLLLPWATPGNHAARSNPTLGVSCCRKPERSVGWRQSAARHSSARDVLRPPTPDPLYAPECLFHNLVERSCACLFDHFIRQEEQRWWYRDPQRLGRLQVDDQVEFRGLLHR